jgi:hypothetical protein
MAATLATCTSTSRPGSPSTGQTLYETDTKRIIVYSGSDWTVYSSDSGYYALSSNPQGAVSYLISEQPKWHFDVKYMDGENITDWTDDQALTGIVGDTSYCWIDKTGKHKIKTQATAGSQPSWHSTGDPGGVATGEPYLDWDGGDELYPATPLVIDGGYCLVAVGHIDSFNSEYWMANGLQPESVYTGGEWSGHSLAGQRAGDILIGYGGTADGSGYKSVTHPSTKADTPCVQMLIKPKTFDYDSGSTTFGTRMFNAGMNSSGPAYNNEEGTIVATIGDGKIGNTNGQLYEMLAFTSPLSSTDEKPNSLYSDRNTILDYVTARYGSTFATTKFDGSY